MKISYFICLILLLCIVNASNIIKKSQADIAKCVIDKCLSDYASMSASAQASFEDCMTTNSKCQKSWSAKNAYNCLGACKSSCNGDSSCKKYVKCAKKCTGYIPGWAIFLIVLACLIFVAGVGYLIKRFFCNRNNSGYNNVPGQK
eukprot:TRINITY_DN451_c0_g3_i1.p2 TRINITY_DN451_c0_g3~~TRINITY_DN451_c0_g3_i1.p2  ORF type:complete len:145 (-),score=12.70 TRINITY_DN451_c0_g3_i1:290-724(-)